MISGARDPALPNGISRADGTLECEGDNLAKPNTPHVSFGAAIPYSVYQCRAALSYLYLPLIFNANIDLLCLLLCFSIMDAVDALLREIQDGAILQPRSMNDRQGPSSQVRQPFSYSRIPESQQAQHMADPRTLAQSQQPRYGRQDRSIYQSQTGDSTDIPLDGFGQSWFRLRPLIY